MFPVAHWISPTPDIPLGGNLSWRIWSHQRALRPFASAADHAEAIGMAISDWGKLPDARRKKLRVPLERLNRALGATSPIDCAIDLGIALEALLLGELAPNEQISLAFRLRGAWLLGARMQSGESRTPSSSVQSTAVAQLRCILGGYQAKESQSIQRRFPPLSSR